MLTNVPPTVFYKGTGQQETFNLQKMLAVVVKMASIVASKHFVDAFKNA